MYNWTTPTIPIRIRGGAILAPNVRVLLTFAQGNHKLTVEPVNLTPTEDGVTCEVTLSQLECGGFHRGSAKVQCNVVDSNDFRTASNYAPIYLAANLLPEVVNYE